MSIDEKLLQRADGKCELCGSNEELLTYKVEPRDEQVVLCKTCKEQIENSDKLEPNHFRCLSEAMWSEVPAVQVLSYRVLKFLESEDWARDLLEMLYLDDEILKWAKESEDREESTPTKDSNGAVLKNGDSVIIIKDLDVKGAGFTAKRGTVVKNISLTDNPEQIEGKVNGTRIVLLSKFLKKA